MFPDKIKELEKRYRIRAKKFIPISPVGKRFSCRDTRKGLTPYFTLIEFSRFTELHGDRYFADDKAIVGGLAKLGGQTVMVMGHQKASIPKCANTATLVWPIRKDTAKPFDL